MNKQILFIPGLFALGILVGIAMMKYQDDSEQTTDTISADEVLQQRNLSNPFAPSKATDKERLSVLEQEIFALKSRIAELENSVIETQGGLEQVSTENAGALPGELETVVDTPISAQSRPLVTDHLIKAGIDPALAADIVRRKNLVEMKKLELSDRASRDGYLGTSQYMRELDELNQQDFSIREEIGEEAYDAYLYASGQANRVRATSVMLGSPAEQAGMRDGDLILSYGDQQLFDWGELKSATTEGERGEYVNVTIMRNGELMNLWVPRGPLGVRLGSMRVKP